MQARVIERSSFPFLVKPAHLSILFALCAFGTAQAQSCGVLPAGTYNLPVNCTSTTGDASITTVTGTTINASNGASNISASSTIGSTTITVSGTTLNHSNGMTHGVQAFTNTSALGAASIIFDGGVNTITLDSTSDTAALALTSSSNSSANILVTAGTVLNVTNNAVGTEHDALEATATGPGANVSITHQGSGTLKTYGGNGVWLKTTTSGNATADVGSGVNIIVDNTDASSAASTHAGVYIKAPSTNGQVKATSGATIQTLGKNANGIRTEGGSGANTITNTGSITTNGQLSHAIYAQGAGQITIDNYATLTTSGNDSKGIAANYSGTSNGVTVTHHAGASITTNGGNTSGGSYTLGNGSAGILLSTSTSAVGDLLAVVDGDITTTGANRAGGVFVNNVGVGNATIRATGNILTSGAAGPYSYGLSANIGNQTTSRGDASIYYTNAAGTVETRGSDSTGLYAYIDTNANGNARIENAGTVKTSGNGLSPGIWARVLHGSGDATIINHGAITTTGAQTGNGTPSGIRADTQTGNVSITNSGAVSTAGESATAIRVNTGNAAQVTVSNSGALSTQNSSARGINVYVAGSGNVDVTSSGRITTSGSTLAGGILVNTTGAHISSDLSGNITTAGTYSPAIELISTRNAEGTASNRLYFHDGTAAVGAGSNAVSLWTGGGTTSGSGEVRIGANAVVDASRGLSAVQNLMPEDSLINIDHGARIIGGTTGVAAGGQRIVLNTAGDIGSMNDLAIFNGSYPLVSQQMDLTNQSGGVITGYITLGAGVNSMINAGQWQLRNVADTNGDQTRDTYSVAVSDFGGSGNNTISNSGTLALLGDNGQASTLNNAGAYNTGYAANAMALGGAAQGQILNVKTFTNSGAIDLGPANPAVGDVLLISGGNTPGANGGGTYLANGGQIILDTVLNEGGANSASDMLIVDGTQLGGGADKISVINVGGAGALTVGNGIELVRVLDKTRSAGGVFQLGSRVVSGVYEYDLYQGGVDADAGDGNWYLRSIELPPAPTPGPTPEPGPQPAPQPRIPDSTPVTPARPEPGVYLRNMTAASGMFMHTLHDRLGEPQFTDKYQADTDGKVSSLWVRIVGNHSDGKAGNGAIDMKTDNSLIHLGGDLARWSSDGQDRWQIGLMGAYGRSDTDANMTSGRETPTSHLSRTASGNVDGYGAGAYLTWYGNRANKTGPYIDLWGMYGWYQNKVQGYSLAEEKYDSTNWTVSAETGYALIAHDGEQRQWMIEPQAQLAYNSYRQDNHREQNDTWVTDGNSDGIVTRLGARVYRRSKLGDNGVQPFVEANWWHGTAQNTLRFNGALVDDGTPENTYELKAGAQGEIAKNWQLWGHVGGRWGQNSYRSYEGMIGVKYQF